MLNSKKCDAEKIFEILRASYHNGIKAIDAVINTINKDSNHFEKA